MARICRSEKVRAEEFKNLLASSNSAGERNDCVVRALALVCDVSYEVAHEVCRKAGRKDGDGMYRHQIKKALASLGYKWEPVSKWDFIRRYPKAHRILLNVTTHHPKRFNKVWADGNNYMMFINRHVGAVINGVMHDHTTGRACRAEEIWKITKA